MKLLLVALIAGIVGFAVGWSSIETKEEKYRKLIKKAGISDEQVVEAFNSLPEIMSDMEKDNRMTTVVSLAALRSLEVGKIDETKRFLAQQLASYYVIYGPPDHPDKTFTEDRRSTLEAIDRARKQSVLLDAAIAEALDNVNK
jgi:hypothetical protein